MAPFGILGCISPVVLPYHPVLDMAQTPSFSILYLCVSFFPIVLGRFPLWGRGVISGDLAYKWESGFPCIMVRTDLELTAPLCAANFAASYFVLAPVQAESLSEKVTSGLVAAHRPFGCTDFFTLLCILVTFIES